MKIERLNSWDEATRWRNDWERLAGEHPFLNWDWQTRWWQNWGHHRELCLLRISDEAGETKGLCPWFVDHSLLQGSVMRFIGSGRACSDHMDFICCDEHRSEVVHAISSWLLDEISSSKGSSRWNLLELDGLTNRSPASDHLSQTLAEAGVQLEEKADIHTWQFPIRDSWENYLAQTVGKRYRRKFRKLDRDWIETQRTDYFEAKTNSDIEAMIGEFMELHRRRREMLNEQGCFTEESFDEFLSGVARDYLERGNLRFGRLLVDQKTVAYSFGFQFGKTHYLYQTGIDPDSLECSPGFLLNMHILKAGFERGVETIDFLRGDERYKSEFGAEAIPCRRVRLIAPDTASRLRHQICRAGGSVRNWAMPVKP